VKVREGQTRYILYVGSWNRDQISKIHFAKAVGLLRNRDLETVGHTCHGMHLRPSPLAAEAAANLGFADTTVRIVPDNKPQCSSKIVLKLRQLPEEITFILVSMSNFAEVLWRAAHLGKQETHCPCAKRDL